MRRSRLPVRRELLTVLLSLVIGFTVATWLRVQLAPVGTIAARSGRTCSLTGAYVSDSAHITPEPPNPPKNVIFVGVMTAKKFLTSRAVAVNRTWAQTIPGKVNFFSSEGSSSVVQDLPNMPVVSLHGVDDSYPPQKKSFMMLKYMHDHYIDKYEWFMRTDDDVYVNGDKLETFLRSLNGSAKLFLGQAGLGNTEEVGLLNLQHGDNFCMGGPGMIFSRATLKKIAPHISYCLKNLWSTHEDVEVGRCVKKFAEIDCTWSYEMQSLFYNNYNQPAATAFQGNLQTPDIHKAITLHPIKNPPYLYRLHNYLHTVKIADLRLKSLQRYREIHEMKLLLGEDLDEPPVRKLDAEVRTLGLPSGLMKYSADSYEDVIPWNFFAKSFYNVKSDSPRGGIVKPVQAALDDIVMQVMGIINSNSMKIGRTIDFKEILYGYTRVVPHYGADYVLDLLLMYNKHKGKSRRLPVRRHAYLQQQFGKIEFKGDDNMESLLNEGPSSGGYQNTLSLFGNVKPNPADSLESRADYSHTETIHFVLPLSGRFEIFQRFMQNIERTCLIPGENIKLLVVLFKRAEDDPSEQIVSVVESYQSKYPNTELKVLRADGDFSRGLALELGASQFPKDALLFFVDVDMYLTPGFLTRCRANTKVDKRVYYPIVFSQYSPAPGAHSSSQVVISKEAGFFRHYGFGIVCLYNSDLSTAGGLDSSIIGWGMEDVDLYQKFVVSNITVFRAPDPSLVHIYHEVVCDPNLEAKQYQMCLGSKASTYGSSMQLSKEVEKIKLQQKEEVKISETPKR